MALKKKPAVKSRTWNKGLEAGQKDAFTPAQVKRIRQVLAGRGVPGLRDLALFSVAIDTMLQGPELRNLTVKDVQLLNGTIRSIIEVARTNPSDAPCPRQQRRHLENGLPCPARSAQIMSSQAVATGVLVR